MNIGSTTIEIYEYFKARVRGLSGDLRLNRRSGTRDEFALDIVELKHSGLRKTATWTTREGLKFSAANRTEQDAELSKTLEGMTLRVVSVLVRWTIVSDDTAER